MKFSNLTIFTAELLGTFGLLVAATGSIVYDSSLGNVANLCLNFPNHSYPVSLFYGVEIIATIMLMGVILTVVHIKGLNKFAGLAIGAIIALDVYFLGPISGASMNPIRSLSPAIVTGIPEDLWLYLSAPFIGSAIAGLVYHQKFSHFKNQE